MAAVIAHEVKNPLAGVRGAIQIIGTRLPKDSKDALIVGEIVSRIDALNELMKDLLLFARPPQPKVALVDMGTLVMTTSMNSNASLSTLRGVVTRSIWTSWVSFSLPTATVNTGSFDAFIPSSALVMA